MKWLIFDMMGVSFKDPDDVRPFLIPYLQNKNQKINPEDVQKQYSRLRVGKITSTAFWRHFGLENRDRDYLLSNLRFDEKSLLCAREYAGLYGYRLSIISNDASEWSKILRSHYKIDEVFELSIISGDTGFAKPDLRLYREFLKRTGKRPSLCVYIDDNPKYLRATKELGWVTINFKKYESDCTYRSDYTLAGWEELDGVIAEIERRFGSHREGGDE